MRRQRHDLVYIAANSHFSIHSCHLDQGFIKEQVRSWLARGLPCVFARQLTKKEEAINLGLSLFCAGKKERVGLSVEQNAVLKYQSLPSLGEMRDFFVRCYGIELSSEIYNFGSHPIKVYGSFLFHYLTGQPYVNLNSDLDLLVDYPGCSLDDLNRLIIVLTNKFKRCIDGELRFPDLGDLAMRELLDLSAEKILLKRSERIELFSRATLYERYPSLCSN